MPLKSLRAIDDFDVNNLGYSAVPILGYDDKSGWLFGAAAFIYSDTEPGINAGFFGVTNGNDFHSTTLNYEQRNGPWLYAFHGLAERAFDNYYGEGDLTDYRNPYRMSLYHFEAKPALLYRVRDHLRLGLFDDYRSRDETTVVRQDHKVPGDPARLFPNESTNAIGIRAIWDTRDKIINTRNGELYQMDLSYGPPNWSSTPGPGAFYQLQLDMRHFSTIYYHLVAATRFWGAVTYGYPSYLFRYRMGGLDTLRGYKDNRFRGDDFFVLQEELRYYIRKWISVNASIDLGDIGDSKFKQLKLTGQLGLRLGLPPDWGQKLRVDMAYGWDQSTFQIQFGEVF